MAFKIQYNKNALQDFKKQLLIRQKALPVLKNKETALRNEIRELKKVLVELNQEMESLLARGRNFEPFWVEFPDILSLKGYELKEKNVVGVKIPVLEEVSFSVKKINWLQEKAWLPAGVELLKQTLRLQLMLRVAQKQLSIMQQARKKTTQKVNLYEKVQIPNYEEAIIRVKRFLEDKDNIAKAAQKIMKNRTKPQTATA